MNYTLNKYRIGGTPIKTYDIAEGGDYASKWGATDFYPNCEQNLRELFASAEDFATTECLCKKELVSVRFARHDHHVYITVTSWIDDLWDQSDLICDALWETKLDNKISEDKFDVFAEEVRDMCFDAGIDDSVTEYIELAYDATYEQAIERAEFLETSNSVLLDSHFARLCDIVKEVASYID